jgi:hypothetical protein
MDYAALRASVESAMGRADIPAYVYELASSTINTDLRLLEMEVSTTLTAAETVTLPSDFLELTTLYVESGGSRFQVMPSTEQTLAAGYSTDGRPSGYAVHNGELTLSPAPSAGYTLTLRYYARQPNLVADADTNDILTNYPGLYLYLALGHAAIWAKDDQSAANYASVFEGVRTRVEKADVARRLGATLRPRNMRPL